MCVCIKKVPIVWKKIVKKFKKCLNFAREYVVEFSTIILSKQACAHTYMCMYVCNKETL